MEQLQIRTVDMHAGGEPCRIVMEGLPEIKGATMREKQEYIRQNYDYIRTSLMLEPRGHKNMFGAFLLPPCHEEADFGALFMFGSNFEDMCGHATICISTMLVDRGLVRVTEPETVIRLDTPAGVVEATVRVEGGKARSVSLVNVPSFLYAKQVVIPTAAHGEVAADIVYAGNPFLLLDADLVGEIEPQNGPRFIEFAKDVIAHAKEGCRFIHPDLGELPLVIAEFYKGDRNVVVFGDGQIDRSPCGTGTGARVVHLHEQGRLALDEDFRHHGIVGTEMIGRIIGETRVGDFPAYITRISGTGTVVADSLFYIGEDDPLYKGFVL